MNEFTKSGIVTMALLCVGTVSAANAQSLKDKVIGAWTLTEGSEIFQDGKKVVPWSAGSLILDSTGHMSFFVIGKDRPKGSGDPRAPVGPVVAYYGTYQINDADNTLTYNVEHATNPSFDGGVRTQKVSFKGNMMTTTGSNVQTPQGTITPVNEWKKAQ
jgi:Lipocalin-like domain